MAGLLSLSGRTADAIRWLRRAGDLGMRNYPFLVHHPFFSGLQQDPGFRSYLEFVRKDWEREIQREVQDPLLPPASS